MASALAQAAEPDNATDARHQALTVAIETKSQRTMHELVRVCALLAPWRSQPASSNLGSGDVDHRSRWAIGTGTRSRRPSRPSHARQAHLVRSRR